MCSDRGPYRISCGKTITATANSDVAIGSRRSIRRASTKRGVGSWESGREGKRTKTQGRLSSQDLCRMDRESTGDEACGQSSKESCGTDQLAER